MAISARVFWKGAGGYQCGTAASRQAGMVGGSLSEFPGRPGGPQHRSWTPSWAADGIDFMVRLMLLTVFSLTDFVVSVLVF